MDITSLYYFMELTKDMHMSRTANRLFLSQQTLSNHIQRVEEYYGVKLFHRRPALQLTVAGREVLRFAENLVMYETNLKAVLADVIDQEHGEIIIGASSPRSNSYLPHILPAFTARYPNVQIVLVDRTSDQLEQLVIKNELDFAVCIDPSMRHPNLKADAMLNDAIYFCVSDKLMHQYYGKEAEHIKAKALHGAHLEHFSKLPFLIITPNNRLGKRIDRCFDEAGYRPRPYMLATYTTMTVPFCNQSLAACFTSQMNLSEWKSQLNDNVNIFPLHSQDKPVSLSIHLVHHRQRYLSHYARYFLELTEQYFQRLEGQDLTRIVL